MESQLFEWDGFDVIDTMCFQFYNCTLKKEIGRFLAEEKIETIVVDYERGKIQLYKDGSGSCWEYDLHLVVLYASEKFIEQKTFTYGE